MGPTNIALVKLFRADQALRVAQEHYESAAKSVRILERKVNDLTTRHTAAKKSLMEQQAKTALMDQDLKGRDAHIDKLRAQQHLSKNAKEYQVFLSEINTEKVDRNKLEEETLVALEKVETTAGEVKVLHAQLDEEQKKLDLIKGQLGGKLAQLQEEIDKLKPDRQEAFDACTPKLQLIFERLAERHDGEALAALVMQDRRREEYLCGGCHLGLVVDIYNRLHSRDEVIMCPACGRMLYIPDDLPPEAAIIKVKEKKPPKKAIPGAAIPKQLLADSVVNSVDKEEDEPAETPATPDASTNDAPATGKETPVDSAGNPD